MLCSLLNRSHRLRYLFLRWWTRFDSGKPMRLLFKASALALAWTSPQARADFISLVNDMAQVSNYAVFGLNSASQGSVINASNVTINGNVGVSNLSTLSVMAPSTINGNVYYQDSGSVSGPGHINGSTIQTSLSSAVSAALDASTQAQGLTPTQMVNGNVTSAMTFTRTATSTTDGVYVNVIDINGNINLNNANITLSGDSSDYFIINVTGTLSLTGTASLDVSGVPASQVIYNFTGATGTFNTHVGDEVNGTILAPSYSMNLDGTWNGEIIGGPGNISLLSNASVTQDSFQAPPSPPPPPPPPPPPQPVPEPTTLLLWAGLGLGLAGGGAIKRYWRREDTTEDT